MTPSGSQQTAESDSQVSPAAETIDPLFYPSWYKAQPRPASSPSSAPAQHRCSSPGFAGAGWGDTQQYWSPLWAQGAEPACSPLLSPLSPAWGSAWTFMTRCGGAAAPSSALSLFQHGVQAVGPGRETWDGSTSTSVPGADRQ